MIELTDLQNVAQRIAVAGAYVDRGWRIMPVWSVTPSDNWVPNTGSLIVSAPVAIPGSSIISDAAGVFRAWTAHQDADIAIVTGSPSPAVFAIDPSCPQRTAVLDELHHRLGRSSDVESVAGDCYLYLDRSEVGSVADLVGTPGTLWHDEGELALAPPSRNTLGSRLRWIRRGHITGVPANPR